MLHGDKIPHLMCDWFISDFQTSAFILETRAKARRRRNNGVSFAASLPPVPGGPPGLSYLAFPDCLLYSHRVDRGVPEVVGVVCDSAMRCTGPVHPCWYDLLHQKLETGSTSHSCSTRTDCYLYMVWFRAVFFFFFFKLLSASGILNVSLWLLRDGAWAVSRCILESARWLLGRGKTEEAKRLITKVATINKQTVAEGVLEKVRYW